MVNLTINQNRKTKTAILAAVILLMCSVTISFANAQTFSPPQIPNYNAPSNNNPDNGLTGPSSGAGGGDEGPEPTAIPTTTPAPQTDYTPLAIAIIAVAIIAAAIIAWTINQKRKSSLPSLPN
jgi:nitrate/nitrite transporter NarK